MNKSESKYFNTAAKMDEALLKLLEKKDFSYITISEICKTAKVNRSTFYLHYETVDDLLSESVIHILQQFMDYMPYKTGEFIEKLPDCPLNELYLITPEYLTPYLTYIKENRRIFMATVDNSHILRLNDAFAKLNRYVLTPILNRYSVPIDDQRYMTSFFIDGLMAVIKEWLKDDCKDSIEHIISVIQKCIRQD